MVENIFYLDLTEKNRDPEKLSQFLQHVGGEIGFGLWYVCV